MKRAALGMLASIAMAPFVLAVCAPRESAVAVAPVETVSTAAPPPPTPETSPPPPPEPPPPVPPPAPEEPIPAYKGRVPTKCAELDKAMNAAFSEGSCASEADCTTGAAYCSCHVPISRTGKSHLDALNKAFGANNCVQQGPPRPCATCAPPRTPKCVGGKCR